MRIAFKSVRLCATSPSRQCQQRAKSESCDRSEFQTFANYSCRLYRLVWTLSLRGPRLDTKARVAITVMAHF